jgi:hypothetical protein
MLLHLMLAEAWRHTVPIFRSLDAAVSHAGRILTTQCTCSPRCLRYMRALPALYHTDDMNETSRDYNGIKPPITSDHYLSYGVSFWLHHSLIYPTSPNCTSSAAGILRFVLNFRVVLHLLSRWSSNRYGNISSTFICIVRLNFTFADNLGMGHWGDVGVIGRMIWK